MREFDDEGRLPLALLDDPVLSAEVRELAALELANAGFIPREHSSALGSLDPALIREIGAQASLIFIEQQAALLPPPSVRLVPVPVSVPPVYSQRSIRRNGTSLPILYFVLMVIIGGILLGNMVAPGAGVDSSSSGTASTNTTTGTVRTSNKVVHSGYSVTTGNELSAKQIDQLFAENGSPAVGNGQAVVDLGLKYRLDDIYFPAWYLKETSMGKGGVASVNNPTGMECSDLCPRCSGADGAGRNWCEFDTIPQGFEAWFKQTRERYVSGLIDQTCSYQRGKQVCTHGVQLTTVYLISCGPDGQGMYDGGTGCAGYAHDIQGIVDGWRTRFGT